MKLADSLEVNLDEPEFLNKIKLYLSKSLDNGYEGLLVKSLDSKTFYDSNGRT